jgi:hypothetical protein
MVQEQDTRAVTPLLAKMTGNMREAALCARDLRN